MKKENTKKQNGYLRSVGCVSLGCAKNKVDLQVMLAHLVNAGYKIVSLDEKPDILIINTCAFIQAARDEAAEEIARAAKMRKAKKCKAVIISGCMPQRYREEFLPDVADAFIGIDELDKIVDLVKRLEDKLVKAMADKRCKRIPFEEREMLVSANQPNKVFDSPISALRLTGQAYAYLKIAEGCAHRCAYCAIPAFRGNYRSRSVKSIVDEAKTLVKTGVRELNIIAQDPLFYGLDFKDGTNIVTLLKALDKIKGDFWIRVLYSYPNEITQEFIDWMNTSKHAVKYMDVPLQHTDQDVLRAMNRSAAIKASADIADKLRKKIPGVTLRTTVMTGFPGETAEKFNSMLKEIKRMQFDYLGVFAFSPEEGTPAEKMKQIPEKIRVARAEKVSIAQNKIWDKKVESYFDREFRALVVAPGIARLPSQAPDVDGVVYVNMDLPVGEFADITIQGADGYDFIAYDA
ncbi:MAG: 30S ribosomal protein S12 methylthiotransferase RimO [Kiritimatiellae bacterium]|nr:30S ribosomal protein S12 methylthiotransferase RimO [Kiritimatiellia bacterium]